jgi:SAM-dependent methyltransferase
VDIKKKFISFTLKLAKLCPGLHEYLCRTWNINTPFYWDQQYGDDKAQCKWGSQIRLQFYDLAASVLPKAPATILDVGSGLGFGAKHLMGLYNGWDIKGLDLSAEAGSNAVIETHCVDLLTEPIPGQYDYLLVIETLEHFSEPKPILKKIYDAALKGVIVTIPYKGGQSPVHPASFDEQSFSDYNNVEIKINSRKHTNGATKKDMLVFIKRVPEKCA